jgi:hypothetical protein
MNCAEPVIPISLVIDRQTRERDALRAHLRKTPWWRLRERWAIGGAISMLIVEIAANEQLAGSCQPILRDQPVRLGPGMEDRIRNRYRGGNSASARTRP